MLQPGNHNGCYSQGTIMDVTAREPLWMLQPGNHNGCYSQGTLSMGNITPVLSNGANILYKFIDRLLTSL